MRHGLTLITRQYGDTLIVTAPPATIVVSDRSDMVALIEHCFSDGASAVLLGADNLDPAFFDLRSGLAGALLQQLRNYHIRLAIVAPHGQPLTQRFRELLIDEAHGTDFRMFHSVAEAEAWVAHES